MPRSVTAGPQRYPRSSAFIGHEYGGLVFAVDRKKNTSWPPMNADERREPRATPIFPEDTKRTKPRRPRPSAAGNRVSPRPARMAERPALAYPYGEFFTPYGT